MQICSVVNSNASLLCSSFSCICIALNFFYSFIGNKSILLFVHLANHNFNSTQ